MTPKIMIILGSASDIAIAEKSKEKQPGFVRFGIQPC